MMRVYVEGIGLYGPGLDGWAQSAAILAGEAAYIAAPTNIPASSLLPAAERRRAPQTVKLALAAGTEAFAAAGRDPAATATVFTSSGGDGQTLDDILAALATPSRELSPTRFHNSVHNAAAGYWSIATGATPASTSLCAHDDSFIAGLLEAMVQAASSGDAVALIAYDIPYPSPLFAARPVGAVFSVAMVLSPQPGAACFASIEAALSPGACTPTAAAPALEELRQNTPAGRGRPLLEVLARNQAAEITLSYLKDMVLRLKISPYPAEA